MPSPVRLAALIVASALWASLALAGCGTAAGLAPAPKVTLKLSAPADDHRVSSAAATIRGSVTPIRARVEVLGRPVPVSADGSFASQIALSVGTNLIDVEASAPRSTGAVTAVRVIRFLLVTVPQVSGESPAQATAALTDLGLAVTTQNSHNPFNFLIPKGTHVCSSSPAAGTRVDPGSTVTLRTGKLCGF